jgi:putative DNA primase/helicase
MIAAPKTVHRELLAAKRAISTTPAKQKLFALEEEALRLAPLVESGDILRADAVDALIAAAEANDLCDTPRQREDAEHVIGSGLLGRSAGVYAPSARAKPNGSASTSSGRALIVQRAHDVILRPIEWLWPGRIAIGKHTLIAGEPGLGKSQVAIALVASVTTAGALPCGEGKAPLGKAIILSAEDATEDTIAPRLIAAAADLEQVHIVTAVHSDEGKGRRTFNLQTDLDLLERKITELGDVRLVIIDPISSYLGPKLDSHVNAAVRGVLEPVADLANRQRIAAVSITHMPKGTGQAAINRFIGSIAFVAAARSAFMVTRDPENDTRKLLLPVKNNLAPLGKGLAFRLQQHLVRPGIVASSVAWDRNHVETTVDEALRATDERGDGKRPRDEATEFLRDALSGGAVPVVKLKDAAANAGLSWATVRRAKECLGVIVRKVGMDEGWVWEIGEGAQNCRR